MSGTRAAKMAKENSAKEGSAHVAEHSSQTAATGIHDHVLSLQHSAGNRAVNQALKADTVNSGRAPDKLTISQPDDKYEQEADRVADQVICLSESVVPQQDHYKEKGNEVKELERPKVSSRSLAYNGLMLNNSLNNLGSGQPLDHSARLFFEPRFGHDLSHVRVHADNRAADSARSIHAKAYTLGHHIVFEQGQYAPGIEQGRRLLAHELTHIVQQQNTTGLNNSAPLLQRKSVSPNSDSTGLSEELPEESAPLETVSPRVVLITWIRINDTMTARDAFVAGLMKRYGSQGITAEIANQVANQVTEWVDFKEDKLAGSSSPDRKLTPGLYPVVLHPAAKAELEARLGIIKTQELTYFEKQDQKLGLRPGSHRSQYMINRQFQLDLIKRYQVEKAAEEARIRAIIDEKKLEKIRARFRMAGKVVDFMALMAAAPLVAIAAIEAAPLVIGGAKIIGAEAIAMARISPLIIRNPVAALTLVKAQISANPDIYIDALEATIGVVGSVVESGGPKKFAEQFSENPTQALEFLFFLMSHQTSSSRAKAGISPKGVKVRPNVAAEGSAAQTAAPEVAKTSSVATRPSSAYANTSETKGSDPINAMKRQARREAVNKIESEDPQIRREESKKQAARSAVSKLRQKQREEGKAPKGGKTKDIDNSNEKIWGRRRKILYPERRLIEQVSVSIKTPDGKVHPAPTGDREIDFVESIPGSSKHELIELKPARTIVGSVEGGRGNKDIVTDFKSTKKRKSKRPSKLGDQLKKEDEIKERAKQLRAKVILKGKDFETGKEVEIEIDPDDLRSRVVSYETRGSSRD